MCVHKVPHTFLAQGAVYVTNNAAYSWTAAVQESVDATLNRTVSSGSPRCPCMKCDDHMISRMGLPASWWGSTLSLNSVCICFLLVYLRI